MALFQKRPTFEGITPLYTTSSSKTLLIVGLGNIGSEYDGTRHNIGFMVLDAFAAAQDFPAWTEKKDLKGIITSSTIGSARIILLKPTTFMNLSGEAVQLAAHFYKVPLEQILVAHDELDIDFGTIRTRTGGSSAGHNGIKSVTKLNGEDYGRMRIGIGPKNPPQIDSADFVLQKFSGSEQGTMKQLTTETNAILSEYCYASGKLLAETRSFLV